MWSTVPILVPNLSKEWTATSPKAFTPSHKITCSVTDTAPRHRYILSGRVFWDCSDCPPPRSREQSLPSLWARVDSFLSSHHMWHFVLTVINAYQQSQRYICIFSLSWDFLAWVLVHDRWPYNKRHFQHPQVSGGSIVRLLLFTSALRCWKNLCNFLSEKLLKHKFNF